MAGEHLETAADRQLRLEQVLADYLMAVDVGLEPERQRSIEDHPDLADDLADFFRQQDRLQRMVGGAQPDAPWAALEPTGRTLTSDPAWSSAAPGLTLPSG